MFCKLRLDLVMQMTGGWCEAIDCSWKSFKQHIFVKGAFVCIDHGYSSYLAIYTSEMPLSSQQAIPINVRTPSVVNFASISHIVSPDFKGGLFIKLIPFGICTPCGNVGKLMVMYVQYCTGCMDFNLNSILYVHCI